jgi:flagellar motor switch protein FliN
MPDALNGWNNDSDVALEILDDGGPWDETVELVDFRPPTRENSSGAGISIDRVLGLNLKVSFELGRTNMTIGEVLALRSSSVIELDKFAGEPIDILVNGTRIAQGEVVVDEKLGVRVIEVLSRVDRLASVG